MPEAVEFDPILVGDIEIEQIVIVNTGDADVSVTDLDVASAGSFSIESTDCGNLAPLDECSVYMMSSF